MSKPNERVPPPIGRIVLFAALGGLAVVAGAFTTVGRAVLAIGAVVLVLVLGVGFGVQRHIRRKFPPVVFHRSDVFAVETMIDSARSRLAGGDSAAFVIHPTDGASDAEGQIWLFAAGEGQLERVALELSLPDSSDPSLPLDVQKLVDDGWEIQSSEPEEWILVTRSDALDARGLVLVVVDCLAALFDLPASSTWSCRAFA